MSNYPLTCTCKSVNSRSLNTCYKRNIDKPIGPGTHFIQCVFIKIERWVIKVLPAARGGLSPFVSNSK